MGTTTDEKPPKYEDLKPHLNGLLRRIAAQYLEGPYSNASEAQGYTHGAEENLEEMCSHDGMDAFTEDAATLKEAVEAFLGALDDIESDADNAQDQVNELLEDIREARENAERILDNWEEHVNKGMDPNPARFKDDDLDEVEE